MAAPLVRILDGNTFVVSDERGDIEASPTEPTGLFSFDMRFLSTWVLTVNDIRLNALSTDDLQYFEARFFLVPATGHRLHRRQAVGHPPAGRRPRLPRGADDPQPQRRAGRPRRSGSRPRATSPTCSRSRTRSRSWARTTRTVDGRSAASRLPARDVPARDDDLGSSEPAAFDEHGLTFTVTVEPHGTWTTDLDVVTSPGRPRPAAYTEPKYGRAQRKARARTWSRASRLDRRGAPPRVRLGAAQVDLPAQPRRPRRAAVLAAGRRRPEPAGGRPAVVHDDVRPRQHLHQPPGAAVRAGARRHDPARARRLAGQPASTTSATRIRAGSSTRCATARWPRSRSGRTRRTTARSTRRRCTCPARRVRALDRRPEARPRPRARGAGGAQLDRRVRRPHGQRLHLVQAAQRADGPREPELEGLLELDLVQRTAGCPSFPRATCELQGYAYDAKIRGARLARLVWKDEAYADRLEKPRPPTSSAASTATSGSPTAATTRSPSTRTAARSTRSPRTTASCCGAASSTPTRPSPSSGT